jgi:translocation and assembly module TamA
VRIQVVPNNPVRIEEQNIEFSGAGQYLPQFQVIKVLPEQDVGDVLHHGLYESTKHELMKRPAITVSLIVIGAYMM